MAHDFSLFPSFDQWGTGDEAMDTRLSIALKKVKEDLSIAAINEFYYFGLSLKPRAYNPAFYTTIEFVAKAFLSILHPEETNDSLMKKIKGHYFEKQKVPFSLSNIDEILHELKTKKLCRYKGQIDFYLNSQNPEEKNPFVRYSIKRSAVDLHVKIIMKDFKSYLNGEKVSSLFDDSLFQELRLGEKVLLIDNFAEVWYDVDQIYSLPVLKL
ncbi:MAG: hypothetical protein K2Q18_18395 [Bdellovibrionales bacterium]|nr:hypothetical protein [Bdellovibrionales bacterium]